VASKLGAKNQAPWFIKTDGPVREVRFKFTPAGTPDGDIHALFTISGRTDQPTPSCNIPQPDFEASRENLAFRIPTPLFGLGLVEALSDNELLRNSAVDNQFKRMLGIAGRVNRNPSNGSIGRFGWKAQNSSLLFFAGEAYSLEIGVSNELFPRKRDETPGCVFNANPEDHINYWETANDRGASDIMRLASFMRFLAPPLAAPETPASGNGRNLFSSIGCALCHTPTLKTDYSSISAVGLKEIQPYSDFLLHHMGAGLADDISQGTAGPDEFRTSPLWGLGQRIFFLHDGRTTDLLQAIVLHSLVPPNRQAVGRNKKFRESEASQVVRRFLNLSARQQQDILEFLRSL
jgi:CxxC motif-containing protein (DUF1111 family)